MMIKAATLSLLAAVTFACALAGVMVSDDKPQPRGYSIPLIDLSGEKQRQVIVDKEPGLIRSPDGKQLAVLLRENKRIRNSYVIFSNDEAKTWSAPRELPGALTGDRHTGKYAPDGRLFISFRDTTHESPTKGESRGWVGRYEDIVQGREGQYRVRLMDNHKNDKGWDADCAYPGVEVLGDGAFAAMTYGHWIEGEPPFIVSVRLRLKELEQRAR